MSSLKIEDRVQLSNGIGIPILGFGTFRLEPGKQTRIAVSEALTRGYRLIDTASMYHNEKDVGQAIRDHGISRDDVFITTKLQNSDQGKGRVVKAFLESDRALGLGFIDLFLLHWPVSGLRNESWKKLEELYKEGLCRAIGVSNFTKRHLEELLRDCDIVPMVNQIEFSPFLLQREIIDSCRENGIVVEAYSPLTRGRKFDDERLVKIAEEHEKTPAQILIRFAIQKGTVPLPSSKKPARIRENSEVFDFELTDHDITTMDGWDEGLRVSWDPTKIL